MYYEQIVRGQIAAERIERIADACAKANGRRWPRRRVRLHLPLASAPESADARPQLQG